MLTYDVDARGELSLYEYLYRRIRDDVLSGTIPADEKLPSKRRLADHLGISIVTVENAYRQLVAEGYVRAECRRGYYACETGSAIARNGAAAPIRALSQRCVEEPERPPVFADLTGSTVPGDLFPFDIWARTLRSVLANEPQDKLVAGQDAFGAFELRRTIADYLHHERGLPADPACIVVGAGAQVLNALLVQLLGIGRSYAIEDPGYPRLTRMYEACGAAVQHVALDGGGINVDGLKASGADSVHVMPSHQFPTGLVMPVGRRYELLGWAEEGDRFIIEDEYDSEFRLAGKPIPTLSGIDVSGRVVYLNTFTKSLGPAFRVGYMVLPPHLAQRMRDELGFYSCTVSTIDQLVLARFIAEGHFERHVNRMRVHYRKLRDALVAALGDALGDRMTVRSPDSGIHLILCIHSDKDDREITRELLGRGVAMNPLSDYYQDDALRRAYRDGAGEQRFLVSYSGLDERVIPDTASAIASAVA